MTRKAKTNSRETRDLRGRELRVVQDGDTRSVEGYAVVFNSESVDLWGFKEIVAPGAFTRTLKDNPDVLCLRDHDSSLLLGRTTANTLVLTQDDKGLKFRVELPNTSSANDLAASMKRGDIDACSFGFSVVKQEWFEDANYNVTRTLVEVDLYEVSIVSFPAYPATSAALRSAPPEIRSAVRKARSAKPERRDADDCECDCPECLAGDCADCSDPDCDCDGCTCATDERAAARAVESRDWRETFELMLELRKRRAI